MDKFCVIANSSKDNNYELANYIKTYLESKGKSCILTNDYGSGGKDVSMVTDVSELPKGIQCAIVLGGDGTIIQAANDLLYEDISILGVNLGTLGFLTVIEKQNTLVALNQLLDNEFEIENRMMLEGVLKCQGQEEEICGFALNDFVLSKGGFGHLICVKVYVNEELMDTYIADGFIISTPTGSTGYNLSAGGPVMAPEVEAIILTPICPHSLNNRSVVISAKDKIELEVGSTRAGKEDHSVISLDGHVLSDMVTGDRITIQRAETNTKLVKLNGEGFFKIFRNKLGIDRE